MEKIDFVLIWVDGNDIDWQKSKSQYNPNKNTDSSLIRYRDWDNLKYWFRGIEKFTPWVNKIFFVTCGHLPEWLDTSNPKLEIVSHSDYIDNSYLPTFSANPIEINIHRIKNLSEKFVYFNDDTFIIKEMKAKDFFRKGLPCDAAIISPHIPSDNIVSDHMILNNMEIINKHFNSKSVLKKHFSKWINYRYGLKNIRNIIFSPWSNFPGIRINHLPSSFLKSTFESVWKNEPELLHSVSSNRFRSTEDVNQYLFKNWQLCEGNFYPRKFNIGKSFLIKNENEELLASIKHQKYKMICLNDNSEIENFEEVKESINKEFDTILKEKSSFEI